MPLDTVTKGHTITVLEQIAVNGASMGVDRSWQPADPPRTLDCRVFPGNAKIVDQQGARGVVVPHAIFFNADPAVDERHRLKWGTVVLRIVAPPRNSMGQGTIGGTGGLWRIDTEAWAQDNLDVRVQ